MKRFSNEELAAAKERLDRGNVIQGVGPDAGTTVNEQGGYQSKTPYGFDLIPPEGMFDVARVFKEGAEKYARDNWRKIPAYDHANHLLQHIFAWLAGDTQDDHLAHAACRALMLVAVAKAEAEERAKPIPFGQTRHNCGLYDKGCLVDEPDHQDCVACNQWVPKRADEGRVVYFVTPVDAPTGEIEAKIREALKTGPMCGNAAYGMR